jgi:hypothetical protein
MGTSKTRLEKLERQLSINEGVLSLPGAIFLVALYAKRKKGESLTGLEKSMADRLERLPLSPQVVKICEDFRSGEVGGPEGKPIHIISETMDAAEATRIYLESLKR